MSVYGIDAVEPESRALCDLTVYCSDQLHERWAYVTTGLLRKLLTTIEINCAERVA